LPAQVIAGLETPEADRVLFDGRDATLVDREIATARWGRISSELTLVTRHIDGAGVRDIRVLAQGKGAAL